MIKLVYSKYMSDAAQKVIEEFEALNIEDKEYVKGLIEKIMNEARREEIYRNAETSREEVSSGYVKFGSASDMIKALNVD